MKAIARLAGLLIWAAQADWSPDGRWLVFARFDLVTNVGTICLIRPDGTDAHALNDSAVGVTPDWT